MGYAFNKYKGHKHWNFGKIPWNKGKTGIYSKETIEKIRQARLNQKDPVLGKHWRLSEETRKKMSLAKKGVLLIKDRSKLKEKQIRNDSKYQDWSKSVKNRDGWKCKIANSDCSGQVIAHHILVWRDYPELRYKLNNGITLCRFHHPRKRKDEIELSPYFQSLVMEIKTN